MAVTKGQELELEIEQFADRGKSIARVDGYVVFVPHGVPGDRVRVAITRRRKKFAEGRIVELIRPSPERVDPVCRYFGTCGGCKWQNIDYEAQLDAKHQTVFAAFRHHGGFGDVAIQPVIGAKDVYGYRNKMEFSFSANRWLTDWEIASDEIHDKGFALGLHVPGRFDKVLDISSCDLVPPNVVQILNGIRDAAREWGWKPWHIRKQEGYLRHLVIRIGQRTGELMVDLVTSAQVDERNRQLVSRIESAFPQVTTVVNTINSGPAQTAIGSHTEVLAGPGFIREQLGRFTFEIGPKTFFQTNTAQAERLYEIAMDYADLTADDHVYDLYCGCGSISLFAADRARSVIGVELVPEAVDAANRNALNNGVENCQFVVGDMLRTFNNDFIEQHGRPNVAIVDPPRAGLHPKVTRRLARLGADRIVYVSCNPLSQVRDLVELNAYYDIAHVQPVDLFPQTHHVESVALLKRREVK